MIRLRTLGAVQLLNDEGTDIRSVLAQPKRVALLAYLAAAAPRGFHRRDTLLGLFWPESDTDHARGALNQAIYQLRVSLGGDTIVSRGKDELGLDPDRIWCDVAAFEDAVDSGATREALELYRGDFLAGFHLSDTVAWEHWLESRRRHLRGLAAGAAWKLAEEAVDDRPADAGRWGRRALSLTPGDEGSLRRLIELLDLAGDRVGAVRAFEEAAERFDREYGIEPSPETRRLVEQVRARGEGGERQPERLERPTEGVLDVATTLPNEPEATPPDEAANGTDETNPTAEWLRRRASTVVLGLALLLVLVASVFWWRSQSPPAADASEALRSGVRLAVLPFENLSSDPEHAFFTDGLHEELISALARMRDLRVIAGTSVESFRDSNLGVGEIAEALDVRAVLEGSVRWSEDSLRVNLQLIDAATEEHLWLDDYDVELTDVLSVQRDIAEQVARALQLRVRSPERLPEGAGTEKPEAYRAYLTGRYFLGRLDPQSFIEARDHFVRALDVDPTFAAAWGGLAEAYTNLTSLAVLPAGEAYPVAREAARTALDLDPGLAEAHASLGAVLERYYWDSDAAEEHFDRALELDPSSARARRLYAAYLRNLGRFEEALKEIRVAQELDPLFAFSRLEEGSILYMAGRYDEAVAQYRELLRVAPGMDRAYVFIGLARAQQGRYEEALDAVRRMDPEMQHPDAIAIRGYVYGRMGRPDEARRMIRMLDELPGEMAVSPFQKAVVWVGLGEHETALDLLERAAEEPSWHMRLLKVEPSFDPLRSHPRFEELLRRVDLAD